MPDRRSSRRRLIGSSVLWVAALVSAAVAAPAPARGVPAPATAPERRFGVYAWGFDDSSYPVCEGCPDRLNWAAGKVAAAGSRTIRVYLGARDDYRVNPPVNPEDGDYLARIVAGAGYPYATSETAYAQLFADPRFDVYLLTVYTPAGNRNDWVDGWAPDQAALEREQIATLGDVLLRGYPRKTFILLNWEGDNAIRAHEDDPAVWEGYLGWTRARSAGVRAAQARNPGSAARLFAGLEFNQVRKNGAGCGSDGALVHRCVVDFVGPRADVDYYSYSSWETLFVKITDPKANLKRELGTSLGYALDLLKRSRPDLTPANFLLGEYGFARTAPRLGECRAAAYLNELLGAFESPDAFGVSYAIFWQVLDNVGTGGDSGTYGLFRGGDGGLTLAGTFFRADLRGDKAPPIPGSCPRIQACHDDAGNSCGVVDPASWKPLFTPDSTLSIFGVNFSRAGNSVQVVQGGHRYVVPRDRAVDWWESRGQINAALPDGLTPGPAYVYVTDARGLDSNGQILDLRSTSEIPDFKP